MKISAFMLAALLPLCSANFDLYHEYFAMNDGEGIVWKVFQNHPSRDEVLSTGGFEVSRNVSGRKIGVRCVGWCDHGDRPGGIEVLEMHFRNNPLYHWSKYTYYLRVQVPRSTFLTSASAIYKNRNYEMIGLDGKVYGRCIPFPGAFYEEFINHGRRKFRCLTRFTAADLNG
jgi:hypothetical protein